MEPATTTLSMLLSSSGRLDPVIVTVVPPSMGPAVGVICVKRHVRTFVYGTITTLLNSYWIRS